MKKKKIPDIFSQVDTSNIDTSDIDVTSDIVDPKSIQTIKKTKSPSTPQKINGGGGQLEIPSEIGILALRNAVVFPGTVMPLAVGRPRSRKLLEAVLPNDKVIGVLTQKKPQTNHPQA
ncbi:MAG: LON peptidase substrate-binding domain-containing protein, partial [Planctomycetes bacterium]|nr:LON peptidase substrate-binding domain-containing protein [Planctomycetota bacterium]